MHVGCCMRQRVPERSRQLGGILLWMMLLDCRVVLAVLHLLTEAVVLCKAELECMEIGLTDGMAVFKRVCVWPVWQLRFFVAHVRLSCQQGVLLEHKLLQMLAWLGSQICGHVLCFWAYEPSLAPKGCWQCRP